MLRVISEAEPTWVIGENVAGLTSMEFEELLSYVESRTVDRNPNTDYFSSVRVRQATMLFLKICDDLDAIGYEVQPFDIPACGVDAPHIRH